MALMGEDISRLICQCSAFVVRLSSKQDLMKTNVCGCVCVRVCAYVWLYAPGPHIQDSSSVLLS